MRSHEDVVPEAVNWYVLLSSEHVTDAERQAWDRWMCESDMHRQAWEDIKRKLSIFEGIPSNLGVEVLSRPPSKVNRQRREAIKTLGLLAAVLLPTGYVFKDALFGQFNYDYFTGVGERKNIALTDGTNLVLNTKTAVTIHSSRHTMMVQLHHGEVLVSTSKSHQKTQVLMIETGHGRILPLGTAFNVRRFDQFSRVSLFEGLLKLAPQQSGEHAFVHPQQEIDMHSNRVVFRRRLSVLSPSWQRGYLELDNMPLKYFAEEMQRYRYGIIKCHRDIEQLMISGSFLVDDVDASLRSLAHTFPVRIQRYTRFLIMIMPLNQ